MNKHAVVYSYNAVSFSLKKDVQTPAAVRMYPEDVMLSEISQTHEDKYCMIPLA